MDVSGKQWRVEGRIFWSNSPPGVAAQLLYSTRGNSRSLPSLGQVHGHYLIEHTQGAYLHLDNWRHQENVTHRGVTYMLPCESKQWTKINPLQIQYQYIRHVLPSGTMKREWLIPKYQLKGVSQNIYIQSIQPNVSPPEDILCAVTVFQNFYHPQWHVPESQNEGPYVQCGLQI